MRQPIAAAHPVIALAFKELDAARVPWVILRGVDELADPGPDVDLLIAHRSAGALAPALQRAGFLEVSSRGRGSHRFFVVFDENSGRWLKLDVVHDIRFGRYQQLLSTSLAAQVLGRRRREDVWWVPPVGLGAALLLLHLLLDKNDVDNARIDRACRAVAPDVAALQCATSVLAPLLAPETLEMWRSAVCRFDGDQAWSLTASVRRPWTPRTARLLPRWAANRVARRTGSWLPSGWRGFSVAVIGADGAGKSTLVRRLVIDVPVPVDTVYLGIWRTRPADRLIGSLPGGRLAIRLAMVYVASWRRRISVFRGRLILFDRYTHDLALDDVASRRARLGLSMLGRLAPPDLVLLLDAPGTTVEARKHEHSVEHSDHLRRGYLTLAARDPRTRIINADAPADDVAVEASATIWEAWSAARSHVSQRHIARPSAGDKPAVLAHHHSTTTVTWQRLDWRFLLPTGGAEASVVVMGPGDDELPEEWRQYPSAAPARTADLAALRQPSMAELRSAVETLRPGGHLYLEFRRTLLTARGPRTARGWAEACQRAGLDEVAAHWHAPDLRRTSFIVPLRGSAARDALGRYQGVRFGRAKSLVAKGLLRAGLLPWLIPEGSVVGRSRDGS